MTRLASRDDKSSFPKQPSKALEQMMTQYGSVVLRTAYFYIGDEHLAEDIAQEVFIRAYRHWSTFRGKSSVKTWLTRITINTCRDRLGLKSSQERPTDDPVLLHQLSSTSAENEVMEKINRTTILKHVVKLPPQYQEVIYLYYYLDLNTREIAEATGVPEGTVRGRLHRARTALGEYLTKEGLA